MAFSVKSQHRTRFSLVIKTRARSVDEIGRQFAFRKLAEELDAHRKRVQAQHGLTLTGLYNVLEKLRAGEPLTDKEKLVHDKGLVSVLKQLHDDLDAAVFAAYG